MFFIDFLYFHFVAYFTSRPQTHNFSSAKARTAYVMALITISWLLSILFFTLVYLLNTRKFNPKYIFILLPICLALISFYKNLYITKGRYELLKSSNKFSIDAGIGMIVSWLVLFVSFSLPYIILISKMKAK
jgi:hypothetical protein